MNEPDDLLAIYLAGSADAREKLRARLEAADRLADAAQRFADSIDEWDDAHGDGECEAAIKEFNAAEQALIDALAAYHKARGAE